MSEPITRSEMYLAALNGEAVTPPAPITRMDMYLAYLNGMTDTYPEPITRTEQYLYKLCQNGMGGGGGVTIRNQNKTITENGTYRHDTGYTGLGTVTVNVPQEDPVLQDKTVTENGTVTADAGFDGLGVVTVNVEASGGGEDTLTQLLTDNLQEYSSETVTELRYGAFYGSKKIRKLELPNVTKGDYGACKGCTALTELHMPMLGAAANEMFQGCSSLETINFPNIKTGYVNRMFGDCTSLKHAYFESMVGNLGNGFLQNAVNLEEISFPSWNNGNVGISVFNGCTALKKVDFAGTVNLTGANAFYNCTALKALIIRGSTVGTFSVATALDGSSIAAGTGYIYVPRALLSDDDETKDYRRATNWSVYADQFRAIEGSEYE